MPGVNQRRTSQVIPRDSLKEYNIPENQSIARFCIDPVSQRKEKEKKWIFYPHSTQATYHIHRDREKETPSKRDYRDSRTAFVSSSFPINPRFLICSAFGAFSRGCAASAFRYAICIALVLAAYRFSQAISILVHFSFLSSYPPYIDSMALRWSGAEESVDKGSMGLPLSCGEGIRSNPPLPVRTSSCQLHLLRNLRRSNLGVLARRESSAMGLGGDGG